MRTRSTFDREIKLLEDELLAAGSMVEKQIERAMIALRNLDHNLARRVIDQDAEIDRLRYTIEELAIQIIATQQPMASDLRVIIAALSMIVDMERMGDHAEGIAKIVLMHADQPLLKPLVDLPRMAEIATGMLRRSLDAFVARDVEGARRVMAQDDEIDSLYDQVYRELLTYMLNDPRTIDRATWLLWAAHNLERIADRATNIAERVIFLVTGHMEDANAQR
ncbi:MAG TPA: phosphate signaling complex protein PhoU [Chloroflexota bacterium]|nr:phosphate signaling complex protein PhoU [Chloroflexota bacterium]